MSEHSPGEPAPDAPVHPDAPARADAPTRADVLPPADAPARADVQAHAYPPPRPRPGFAGAGTLHAAALPAATLLFLTLGAALLLPAGRQTADRVWLAGLILTGAPVAWHTLRGLVRGHFAADIVATLAIVAAIGLDQPLAGLIVVLMQTGGEALERYAEGRASDAVRELEAAAPRRAHRIEPDGAVVDLAADVVRVGDTLLVRPGELVPCDGTVVDGRSHVNTATLTGEAVPLSARAGTRLMSGSVNGEGALTVRVEARASQSQYARIVELVRTAQASKSPLQRLADRYAVWFTPITLVVCGLAYLASGDPTRVLAVLVVATPCPLILATPVAIIGGINRAARRQIIVRNGAALERLADASIAVLDKTGTVTLGEPRVSAVRTDPGFDEGRLLRLAGAVEQGSSHVLARALVEAVRQRGVAIEPADDVIESTGLGVEGTVRGRRVLIGSWRFVHEREHDAAHALEAVAGDGTGLRAFIVVDGEPAGVIEYADHIRPGLHRFLEELRGVGIGRTLLLSGDHEANARGVAATLGIQEVLGDLLPEDKTRVVGELVRQGAGVVMLGDGTNDAPALSTATVGMALAGHGGGITTEAADVVLLVDEPARMVEAIRIGRRSLAIARQSIWVGLGLSGTAMVFAAFGFIIPTIGAVLQEAIDVAVILNALRTGVPGPGERDAA